MEVVYTRFGRWTEAGKKLLEGTGCEFRAGQCGREVRAEKMVLDDTLTIVTRDVRSLVAMQGAVEGPMFTTT